MRRQRIEVYTEPRGTRYQSHAVFLCGQSLAPRAFAKLDRGEHAFSDRLTRARIDHIGGIVSGSHANTARILSHPSRAARECAICARLADFSSASTVSNFVSAFAIVVRLSPNFFRYLPASFSLLARRVLPSASSNRTTGPYPWQVSSAHAASFALADRGRL
jgi:hypothetical protein